jgi:hypothetical protein
MVAVVVVVAVAADQKQKLIEFMQPAKPRRDRTTMLTVQTCAEWDTDATLRADIVTEAVHHMTTVREMDEANIAALWRRILAPCFRHNARVTRPCACAPTRCATLNFATTCAPGSNACQRRTVASFSPGTADGTARS